MKLLIICFVLIVAVPAMAEDNHHKIDFTIQLYGLDGKPIIPDKDTQPMTLGDAAANALTATFRDEQLTGTDKVKRWMLAQRVMKAKDVELTVDDIKLIKDLIGKAYGPIIVGQSWSILDPVSAK